MSFGNNTWAPDFPALCICSLLSLEDKRKWQLFKIPPEERGKILFFWFTSNEVMLLLFMLPLLQTHLCLLCLSCVLGYWPLRTMSHGLRSKSLTFSWVCQWEELKDTLWDVYLLYSFTHWMHSIFTHPMGWYAFELWCWELFWSHGSKGDPTSPS